MKKRLLLHLIIIVLALTVLPHCGGGGGGGGGDNNNNNSGGPTTAVLTLSTTLIGVPPNPSTIITDYDVTITLPAGVTVKSQTLPVTDSSVLTFTGTAGLSATSIIGHYTPAAGGTPGTVEVYIVNGSGIGTGALCTVTCDIAAGSHPTASDFSQTTNAVGGLVTSPTNSTVNLNGLIAMTGTVVIK